MPHHRQFRRRDVLRWLGASAAVIAGGEALRRPAFARETPASIPVPPTFMLHSRHRYLLPRLLDTLMASGYHGVTYADLESAITGQADLPPRPIIITIDDLELVNGNPSFETFRAMKNTLVLHGFKGVFAMITSPLLPQNADWWAEIVSWRDEGIEFATHTSFHSNLNNGAFAQKDYDDEIVASARMITERTGQPVRALITPFGSGYDRQSKTIHPLVLESCRTAGIRFVVGIVEGRVPVPLNPAPDDVFYLGRIQPGIDDTLTGALFELNHW
ncbi:MAG: polysaccharide deacetylase family protein [Anaerolineae bacterium]|nr:polysaccharide deacetylase family protein [Anaerolineae bacterium]